MLVAQRSRIERLAIDDLENRKRHLNDYRAQARLAIAEIYDRGLRGSAAEGGFTGR